MSNDVTVKVPYEVNALAAAANFFNELADCAGRPAAPEPAVGDSSPEPQPAPTAEAPAGPTESPAAAPQPEASPSQPAGVELDSAGLPWDNRIHAGNRAKIQDGTWRKKRGVAAELVTEVEAELRQAMAAPASEPAAPAPEPAAPAPEPAAPAPEPAAPAPGVSNFAELAQAVTAKGITPEQLTAACTSKGLASFALLATRPDLVPAVAADLGL